MRMNNSNTKPAFRTGRFARACVLLLTQAIVMQPAAFAFNSTWNVAQQPLFTINPVYPNVVFMIDDSWSMNDYRLPPPPFFSLNNRWPAPGNVTVKYGAGTKSVAGARRVHAALERAQPARVRPGDHLHAVERQRQAEGRAGLTPEPL